MAITDTQKVDYLFKKLGFAVTKTDTNSAKAAANESIASPLLLRGDKVWQQAGDIPATIPGTPAIVSSTTARCPYLLAKKVSAMKRKNIVILLAKESDIFIESFSIVLGRVSG